MIKISTPITLILSCLISATSYGAKWHMPTPYGDANLTTQIALEFAQNIKEATKGELNITVHSGASLVKHPEIPRAVKTGQVQLGEIFIGIMGNTDPVFKHDNIPFLATNFDQAKKLWAAAKPEVEKKLAKENMILLYTVAWPAQSLYTKTSVKSLADLKGAKMRAYSPSTSRLADLMNTTPTTVQVPEIPQAFSTGIIDAMITSPSTGVNGQAWDYVNHYTDIKAWIPKNIVVVNKRAFKRLGKDTQTIVLNAAKQAEEKGWQGVIKKAKEDTQTLAKNGVTVTSPTPTLIDELQKVGETMIGEWKSESKDIEKILERYKP